MAKCGFQLLGVWHGWVTSHCREEI